MKSSFKLEVLLLGVFLLLLGIGDTFGASKFPEKPIVLVVPASAGGGSDLFARTLAAGFEKHKILPVPIVVENKPGGGDAIGMAYVAGKKGDPYYLLSAASNFLLTPLAGKSPVNYEDFTPICNFAFDTGVLLTNANSKFKSMKDLVDYAKANPKMVSMGGTKFGGLDTISTYQIEKIAGIKLNYVAFEGGSEVNVAVMGGHIDMAIGNPCETIEMVKAGKLRFLAVLAEKRLPDLAEVPTAKEQGFNVSPTYQRGLVAPKNIPEDARKILTEALFKYTQTETSKNYFKDRMLIDAWMDGPTYAKFLQERNKDFGVVLKEVGITKK